MTYEALREKLPHGVGRQVQTERPLPNSQAAFSGNTGVLLQRGSREGMCSRPV